MILQALDGYYGRMLARGEAERRGYSREQIGFAVVLSPAGGVVEVIDLREEGNGKLRSRPMSVPASVRRTSGVSANLLWDKTSYAFGRTGKGKTPAEKARAAARALEEHEAFKARVGAIPRVDDDVGLNALASFLLGWHPDRFSEAPFDPDWMMDVNVVFRLDGDHQYIHERRAVAALIEAANEASTGPDSFCLVSGAPAKAARLHPVIKGVDGAQSSGATLVSFNVRSVESYGLTQGENAPVSEEVGARYGEALNRMLASGSRNRLARTVGGATVVFWADTSDDSDEAAAVAAEEGFSWLIDPKGGTEGGDDGEDAREAARLRDALDMIEQGRPVEDLGIGLRSGTRFHVLGLSPAAARLSVRYWIDGTFDEFANRLARHHADLRIEPTPWRKPPSVGLLLALTTALQRKFDNIPPQLAGEVMRSVLTGARYPASLLTNVIVRLRAGDAMTGWHAAVIKAVLERDARITRGIEDTREWSEIPVSLDKDRADDPAYNLGRLFAALEMAQRMALPTIKATIRDRYFGAASATPASVFPVIMRGSGSHTSKLRREGKAGWIEREIGQIVELLPADLPRTLRLEAQGRFAIGYYHQRQAYFTKRKPGEAVPADAPPADVQDLIEENNGGD